MEFHETKDVILRKASYLCAHFKFKKQQEFNSLSEAIKKENIEDIQTYLNEHANDFSKQISEELEKIKTRKQPKSSDVTYLQITEAKKLDRAKEALFYLLNGRLHYYLPPRESCSLKFLCDLALRKKSYIKQSQITEIDPSVIEDVSVLNVMDQLGENETFHKFIPDMKDYSKLDRKYLFSMLNKLSDGAVLERIYAEKNIGKGEMLLAENTAVAVSEEFKVAFDKCATKSKGKRHRAGVESLSNKSIKKVKKKRKIGNYIDIDFEDILGSKVTNKEEEKDPIRKQLKMTEAVNLSTLDRLTTKWMRKSEVRLLRQLADKPMRNFSEGQIIDKYKCLEAAEVFKIVSQNKKVSENLLTFLPEKDREDSIRMLMKAYAPDK